MKRAGPWVVGLVLSASSCSPPPDCARIEVEPSLASPALSARAGAEVEGSWHWRAGDRAGRVPVTLGRAVALVGPRAGEEVWVGLEQDGQLRCERAVRAAEPTVWLPDVQVEGAHASGLDAVVVSVTWPEPALVAWDDAGQPVWVLGLPEDRIAVDVDLVPEGLMFDLTDRELGLEAGAGRLVRWTGELLGELDLPGSHHGLDPSPDGSIARLDYDLRMVHVEELSESVPVMGDALVIATPGERERRLLSTFDWAPVEPGSTWRLGWGGQAWDWTHASGVALGSESALLSLRGPGVVLEVDRHNGEILREIGGELPVELADGGSLDSPHSPQYTENGVLLFHTGEGGGEAVELALGPDGAVERWQHGRGLGLHTSSLGAVDQEGDVRIITYGQAGVLHQVVGDELVRELVAEDGMSFAGLAPVPSGTWER